jgi:hypothetical protein
MGVPPTTGRLRQNYILTGCPLAGNPIPPILDAPLLTGIAGQMVAIADYQNTGTPSIRFST